MIKRALWGMFALLTLNACQQTPTESAMSANSIDVEVFYRERMALPPGSQLVVTLEDVSKMDVASTVIATGTTVLSGTPPYLVQLTYAAADIQTRHRYSVRARIEHNQQLVFTSTEHIDPFADNAEQPLRIILQKVAHQDSKPKANLTNTYWKLLSLYGEQVTVADGKRELFLQMRSDGQLRGYAGCNNFGGGYEFDQQSLRFGNVMSTQMMCIDDMEQETTVHKMLEQTRQYEISGDDMRLLDENGEVIARFAAMYF